MSVIDVGMLAHEDWTTTEGDEIVARTLPEGFHVTTLAIGVGNETAEEYEREQTLAGVDIVVEQKDGRAFVARQLRNALREQCRDLESAGALQATLDVFIDRLSGVRASGRTLSALLSEPALSKEIAWQRRRIETLRTAELARDVRDTFDALVVERVQMWIETATPVSKPKRRSRRGRKNGTSTRHAAKTSDRKPRSQKSSTKRTLVRESVPSTEVRKPGRRSRRRGRKTTKTAVAV